MTFSELLLLFFNLLSTKKFKDFGTYYNFVVQLFKNYFVKNVTLCYWYAKGSCVNYCHLIVLYILKKIEIYEQRFWVRTDYVLFRLYAGEKRDNSIIMLDSFYCHYVQFIIALVEQDHLLK